MKDNQVIKMIKNIISKLLEKKTIWKTRKKTLKEINKSFFTFGNFVGLINKIKNPFKPNIRRIKKFLLLI